MRKKNRKKMKYDLTFCKKRLSYQWLNFAQHVNKEKIIAMKIRTLFALLLLICVAFSCKKKEIYQDPLYVEGERLIVQGQYEAAKEMFVKCLEKEPNSALVHRKLADLYYDHLGRMEYAIYHYEASIRFNPQHEDVLNMQRWSVDARKKLMMELIRVYLPQEVEAKHRMEEQIVTLTEENRALSKRLELLTKARERELKQRVANTPITTVERPALRRPTVPTRIVSEPKVTAMPTTTKVSPALPVVTSHIKYHTVVAGDTLSNIAFLYYGDKRKFVDIQRANTSQFKDRRQPLKEGMILKIPNPKIP